MPDITEYNKQSNQTFRILRICEDVVSPCRKNISITMEG